MESNDNTDYLLIPVRDALDIGLGSQKVPDNKYCLNSNIDIRRGRSYKTNERGLHDEFSLMRQCRLPGGPERK